MTETLQLKPELVNRMKLNSESAALVTFCINPVVRYSFWHITFWAFVCSVMTFCRVLLVAFLHDTFFASHVLYAAATQKPLTPVDAAAETNPTVSKSHFGRKCHL